MNDVNSHHFASTVAINDSKSVLQTEDRRQWVAIDLLPKNIRDSLAESQDGLISQHGRDGDDARTKGASKVMAWVRQSKRGFDVRILRRKPKSGRDEYTDLSVERDDFAYASPERIGIVSELHANDIIHELCDTEARHELPAAPPIYSATPTLKSWHQQAKPLTELHGDSRTVSRAVQDTANPSQSQLTRRMSFEAGEPDTLQTGTSREENAKPKLHVETTRLGSAALQRHDSIAADHQARSTIAIAPSGTAHGHTSQTVNSYPIEEEVVHTELHPATTSHLAEGHHSDTSNLAVNKSFGKTRPNSVHGSDSGYHSEPGSTYHIDSEFDSSSSLRRTAPSRSSDLKTVNEDVEPPRQYDTPGTPEEEVPQSTQSVASMEFIIKLALAKLLQGTTPAITNEADGDDLVAKQLRGHKIAEATRFETDTDAEPPSPSDRKVQRVQIRPKMGPRSYQRKRGTTRNKPTERRQFLVQEGNVDSSDGHSSALERRLTMAKTIDASASPEEAWKVLLASQKLILGAEHTLVLKAKLKRNESRDQQYKGCSTDLLEPLHETEAIAVSFFEKSHPKVLAFSANLKALHTLLSSQQPIANARKEELESDPHHSSDICTSSLAPEKAVSGISISLSNDALAAPRLEQLPLHSDSSTDLSKLQLPAGFHPAPVDSSPVSPIDARPPLDLNDIWKSDRPPHEPKNDLLVLSGLALEAMTRVSLDFMLWLRSTYGPEPEVEPGKVRVRWTCSCGQQLYDDFVENRSGAARELERYLNRPRTHATQYPSSPTTPSSYQPSQNSSFGLPPSSQSSLNSVTPPQQSHQPGQYARSPTVSSLPGYSPYNGVNYEARFLLTCANEDRFTPRVTHLDVQPALVRNDRHLAQELRKHYAHVNRQWWKRLMKIRGLATIEFVQFEIHKNRFADIRKCPDMPDRGSKDYTFEPDDLLPPVGSTYLLHLFQHPEDYEHETLTYLRVPKKNGPLDVGKGWGINLREGFPAERVLVFMLIGFSLASLVFAIAWFFKAKHDIQGAFSVAQWICTIGALCCKLSPER